MNRYKFYNYDAMLTELQDVISNPDMKNQNKFINDINKAIINIDELMKDDCTYTYTCENITFTKVFDYTQQIYKYELCLLYMDKILYGNSIDGIIDTFQNINMNKLVNASHRIAVNVINNANDMLITSNGDILDDNTRFQLSILNKQIGTIKSVMANILNRVKYYNMILSL